ncbi:MAG: arginine deiminase family protein [Planctomycetota bacterium]|nr:arginine deiminase family protein [Planctomycetota bacterium]
MTDVLHALIREVSPAIDRCELTHTSRQPIDIEAARSEHQAYRDLLDDLGCRVLALPAEPDLPDSMFVEDTIVVVDELAIITRPGAELRRAETASVADALRGFRHLAAIEAPGTLDGGDVLRCGSRIWVGLSTRTNAAGIEQLARFLGDFAYEVIPVAATRCLHLKSAATCIGPKTILLNPAWVDRNAFAGCRVIEVDPAEPSAGNALEVAGTVVVSASHPRTRDLLADASFSCRTLDTNELAKAEAGLTCCSVLFAGPAAAAQ